MAISSVESNKPDIKTFWKIAVVRFQCTDAVRDVALSVIVVKLKHSLMVWMFYTLPMSERETLPLNGSDLQLYWSSQPVQVIHHSI